MKNIYLEKIAKSKYDLTSDSDDYPDPGKFDKSKNQSPKGQAAKAGAVAGIATTAAARVLAGRSKKVSAAAGVIGGIVGAGSGYSSAKKNNKWRKDVHAIEKKWSKRDEKK